MTTIEVDGLNEEAFRRSIESRLRLGKASDAVAKLRALIAPFVGPDRILPERFTTVTPRDLILTGWDSLGEALARHDRPEQPVTALSIAFGWPGEDLPVPDAAGCLAPRIETGYFTDAAFPFSNSARTDLLEGYSYHGCTWGDEGEATDFALSVDGIDDLCGALAALEARLLASDNPDEDEIRAGSLGACLLSALLIQAVDEHIASGELPRPLCVMAGSNGVYPYFNVPVAGIPEHVLKAADSVEEDELETGRGVPTQRYSSLLVTGIPRARKRAVLVLDESAEQTAQRNASLRGMGQPELEQASPLPAALPEPVAPPPTAPGIVPIAGGPLLAKKPFMQSWDFRDMLSPAERNDLAPGPIKREPAQPVPAPMTVRDPAAWAPPRPQPLIRPDRPVVREEAPAEPGFSLLEPNIENRLQPLIAVPAEPEPPAPEPVAKLMAKPEETVTFPAPFVPVDPAWPLGIGWLEAADTPADSVEKVAIAEQAPRPSLWTRLRSWLNRRN